jgi:hypothetical protein
MGKNRRFRGHFRPGQGLGRRQKAAAWLSENSRIFTLFGGILAGFDPVFGEF